MDNEDNEEKNDKIKMKSILDRVKFWDLPDWPSRIEWLGYKIGRWFR